MEEQLLNDARNQETLKGIKVKNYSISHPLPLILYKIILYTANKLPISYKTKIKVKEKVLYEKSPPSDINPSELHIMFP